MESNELKIELYPNKSPRYTFRKDKFYRNPKVIHSFGEKQLGYMLSNIPFLDGFYKAHSSHYPIRIKPDDIWLLILQSFSYHVNLNHEELREYFVNFDGKKTLNVKYNITGLENITKEILEEFSIQINEQMKEYLGKELLDILTPDFTTTTKETKIVGQISIMGAFKEYFDYRMDLCGCGIPYIILEGTSDDYKKIMNKAMQLKKYNFGWYIDRILPHINKMIQAKEGNIDIDYFKNIIQNHLVTEEVGPGSGIVYGYVQVDFISGWILNFFGFYKEKHDNSPIFNGQDLKVSDFNKLANQMLEVPVFINDQINDKYYLMKYLVGFVGCEQNEEKEVFPTQGWFFYEESEEREFKYLNKMNEKIRDAEFLQNKAKDNSKNKAQEAPKNKKLCEIF